MYCLFYKEEAFKLTVIAFNWHTLYVFNVRVGVELNVINRHGRKTKSDENACAG